MARLLSLACAVAAFTWGANAQTDFKSPLSGATGSPGYYEDDPTYKVDQTINMEWTTDQEAVAIIVWQEYPRIDDGSGSSSILTLNDDWKETTFSWKVSLDTFITDLNPGETDVVLFFSLNQAQAAPILTTSHYFNVTVPVKPSTTSAAPSSTSATTKSASQSPTTKASASPSPTGSAGSSADSKSDSNSSSGLSKGAVAGIAVGATLGGLLVLGGIAFLLWKRRKGDSKGQYTAGPPMAPAEPKTYYGGPHDNSHLAHEVESPPPHTYTPQSQQYGQQHQGHQGYNQGPQGLYEAP